MSFSGKIFPVLSILWALVILVVSVIPSDELPSLSIWEPDKVMHFLVYGILTFLTAQTLIRLTVIYTLKKSIFRAIGLCILYGISIELIQRALPTRQFDVYDILANSLGCLLGAGLVLLISVSKKRQAR